jgi:aminopeptidase YwaD
MEFLAGDALKGRGSGSDEERIAGEYFASLMRQFGIQPAGDDGSYIQTVEIRRQSFASPPTLTYAAGGSSTTLTHGKEMVVFRMTSGSAGGPLKKLASGETPAPGSVSLVRYDPSDEENSAGRFGGLFDSTAAAVLVEETPQLRAAWQRASGRPVSFSRFGKGTGTQQTALIGISKEAAEALSKIADGVEIEISGELAEPRITHTWNSVGMIKGSDPKLSSEVILLSAHMDHLGVRPEAPGDDKIFNGADDDASGCVAVIELARLLAAGEKPKRTVYFAFFGSEEAGGFGSRYFVANLPFPKEKLVANLQWEMIGRPDAKVASDELWLTGYTLSNLGEELAKHGAKLVNDPHPDQNFFQRSDNYTLARQGIIAHTVSSYGLHQDYHHASDEIGTINFEHMTRSINSMVGPIKWLLNSDFRPAWYEGKDPSQ